MITEKELNTACKKHWGKIEEIEFGAECIEVVLKDGWINKDYNETIWAFGYHHFDMGDYTGKEAANDLNHWLDSVTAEEGDK